MRELRDGVVMVRVGAPCRRRYGGAWGCRVPGTVTAPGPPKAIGKGLFSNAFTAMLLTERYAAGRSVNSLVAGLARPGAGGSPAARGGAWCAGQGRACPGRGARARGAGGAVCASTGGAGGGTGAR